ncbi:hypothetical protein BC628DRAFT_1366806 [Trametes gibbosa]|nr:hypothetical protein BC628DRAFT_1366806 [Trametes gibbosa]
MLKQDSLPILMRMNLLLGHTVRNVGQPSAPLRTCETPDLKMSTITVTAGTGYVAPDGEASLRDTQGDQTTIRWEHVWCYTEPNRETNNVFANVP